MSYAEEIRKTISDGLSGIYAGVPFPLKKLNYSVPGIQKSRIYISAGGTGSGKSKFINEAFMFTLFDDWLASGKAYTLKIYYFSLEIPKEQILAALTVRWLYKRHEIITDNTYLLSYNKEFKPDGRILALLDSDEFTNYISAFEECVDIMDTSINHISFDNFVMAKAREHGTINYSYKETSDGNKLKMFDSYIENDPNQKILFIVDHVALVKTVSGQTKKAMLGSIGDTMIKARNRYRFTFSVA